MDAHKNPAPGDVFDFESRVGSETWSVFGPPSPYSTLAHSAVPASGLQPAASVVEGEPVPWSVSAYESWWNGHGDRLVGAAATEAPMTIKRPRGPAGGQEQGPARKKRRVVWGVAGSDAGSDDPLSFGGDFELGAYTGGSGEDGASYDDPLRQGTLFGSLALEDLAPPVPFGDFELGPYMGGRGEDGVSYDHHLRQGTLFAPLPQGAQGAPVPQHSGRSAHMSPSPGLVGEAAIPPPVGLRPTRSPLPPVPPLTPLPPALFPPPPPLRPSSPLPSPPPTPRRHLLPTPTSLSPVSSPMIFPPLVGNGSEPLPPMPPTPRLDSLQSHSPLPPLSPLPSPLEPLAPNEDWAYLAAEDTSSLI